MRRTILYVNVALAPRRTKCEAVHRPNSFFLAPCFRTATVLYLSTKNLRRRHLELGPLTKNPRIGVLAIIRGRDEVDSCHLSLGRGSMHATSQLSFHPSALDATEARHQIILGMGLVHVLLIE